MRSNGGVPFQSYRTVDIHNRTAVLQTEFPGFFAAGCIPGDENRNDKVGAGIKVKLSVR